MDNRHSKTTRITEQPSIPSSLNINTFVSISMCIAMLSISSPVMPGMVFGSRKSPKLNVSRGIDSEICIVIKAREDALGKILA